MRRALLALAFLALPTMAAPVNAMPWEKHPQLSYPATPLEVAGPDERVGTVEAGTTKAFFEAHALRSIGCDSSDGKKRRVTITCTDEARRETTVYQGEFVGAGYLLIEAAAINGRLLSDAERVALVLSVRQQKATPAVPGNGEFRVR
ncbi:hypothetical protein ACIQW5_27065 [Methylorubrum thiocyanatum]|uniref:hypothetical protein n=1 Tax=Methylorubrum thiocyanatum TaxID=47958 RepID=UPI00383B5365